MMQKTVKKGKREGSGKRLSYVVTESGLVENDDSLDESADQKRRDSIRVNNPRSLLGSINEIDEANEKIYLLKSEQEKQSKEMESTKEQYQLKLNEMEELKHTNDGLILEIVNSNKKWNNKQFRFLLKNNKLSRNKN